MLLALETFIDHDSWQYAREEYMLNNSLRHLLLQIWCSFRMVCLGLGSHQEASKTPHRLEAAYFRVGVFPSEIFHSQIIPHRFRLTAKSPSCWLGNLVDDVLADYLKSSCKNPQACGFHTPHGQNICSELILTCRYWSTSLSQSSAMLQ